MSRVFDVIAHNLPAFPRRRYGVVSGMNTREEALMAARAWIDGRFTDEAVIAEFEAGFAASVGVKHGISFGAARMGLFAVLEAMDFKPGDEIILTAYTCDSVPNAVLLRGLRPVFVDVDPTTFNIDPSLVEAAITPRTRAIVLQHTFGVCADVAEIKAIARKHRLAVIEDAAHSKGCTWDGVRSGAMTEVAIFSTDHSKMLSTLLGGIVTTQDDQLATRLREVQRRSPFLSEGDVRRILFSFIFEVVFYAPELLWIGHSARSVFRRLDLNFNFENVKAAELPRDFPFPCRLSSVQAKLGLSQLETFELNLRHRREIAGWLESKIEWYAARSSVQPLDIGTQSWMRYPVLVRDRRAFMAKLSHRLELKGWCTELFAGPGMTPGNLGYTPGSCPIAEKVSRHIVTFPTHPLAPLSVYEDEWRRNEDWIRANIFRL